MGSQGCVSYTLENTDPCTSAIVFPLSCLKKQSFIFKLICIPPFWRQQPSSVVLPFPSPVTLIRCHYVRMFQCKPSEKFSLVPLSHPFFSFSSLLVARLSSAQSDLWTNGGNLTPQGISLLQGLGCLCSCRKHADTAAFVGSRERGRKAWETRFLSLQSCVCHRKSRHLRLG